jgi:chloramphenicol 3-O-phosphotransferase
VQTLRLIIFLVPSEVPCFKACATSNLRLQELEDGPWSQANVDAGSSKIIPVPHPLGGAIVLGESVLSYFNTQHATRSTQIKPNTSIQVRGYVRTACAHVLAGCAYHLVGVGAALKALMAYRR